MESHATVLAVAGSGKTSAMVHRIQYLIQSGVSERGIRALMYNNSAMKDFEKKLQEAGVAGVKVQTFHALGNAILLWACKNLFVTPFTLLDDARQLRDLANEASKAANSDLQTENELDADELTGAVSTWKAMLTPPDEAQHLRDPFIEVAYRHFERLRRERNLITFDDQIYEAVRLLEREQSVRDVMTDKLEHLIIDEFQDVNVARLQLAKIIAGTRAKVMVVGDDDQCIYEWQGARSSFIKRGFETEFTHYPHARYRLTRSFRYGPLIAQMAANVIQHNTDRDKKELIANELLRISTITVDASGAAGGTRQVLARVQKLFEDDVLPSDIAILVRKYSQSYLVQGLLLSRGIPFYVDGESPWGSAYPVKLALDYLDAATMIDEPLGPKSKKNLERIVQRPPRYVKKDYFERVLRDSVNDGLTPSQILTDHERLIEAGLNDSACLNLGVLEDDLRQAVDVCGEHKNSGVALSFLLDRVEFRHLFESFESSVSAEDDLGMMRALATLLTEAEIPLSRARQYVESMDTRQGKPDLDCIRITTVFKAKGLEWDYVLLPDLLEGQCPDLRSEVNVCINRRHPDRSADATQTLESERRLFYVAITRARKGLHLFADPSDTRLLSRFVCEGSVDSTREAVSSLQSLIQGSEDPIKNSKVIADAASQYAHLKDGLLAMLRRAADDSPEVKREEIDKAVAAINSLKPAPFSYPHAYPNPSEARSQSRLDSPLGLPF